MGDAAGGTNNRSTEHALRATAGARAARRKRPGAWAWARRLGLTAAVVLSAAPSVSRGDEPSPTTAADEAFRRGLERFDAGDHAAAVGIWEELARSLSSDRAWKLSYNLGLAYEALGEATLAVERYEHYVRAVAEQTGALGPELEQRRQHAADRIRAIKSTHGAVHVLVPKRGPVPGVTIDQEPERPAGFVAYLLPGSHAFRIDGRQVHLEVRAGETIDLDTTPPEPPPPRAHTTPSPPARLPEQADAPSFPTAWVLAGTALTLASFTLPLVLRGRAETEREEAEELGRGHTRYPQAADEYDSARTLYHVSLGVPILLGAATLGVATVGIVRIAGAGSRPNAPRGKSGPTVTLVPSGRGASLCAEGRF